MENVALIPFLKTAGAIITLCDQWPDLLSEEIKQQVTINGGEQYLDDLETFDYLFRSPGLPVIKIDQALLGKPNQPVRTTAMDLFLSMCRGVSIGVTGTKGKGTTSTMLGSILEAAGKKVIVAGNIGSVVFDALETIDEDTFVILEMSSFQLEDITQSPKVAILLPISPDHLQPLSERSPNYHQTFDAYAKAKANITAYQEPTDLLIYATDSKVVRLIADESQARRIGVGQTEGADVTVTAQGQLAHNDETSIDLSSLGLRGTHVYLDAALAAVVAREFGVTTEEIIDGLKNFQPLPHRLQTIAQKNNITYVDDSYATAPDAAIAALSAFEEPVIWIGGGSRKGAEFGQLVEALKASTVKSIILLGEEAERLEQSLRAVAFDRSIERVESLEEAVTRAHQAATPGDVVLLSPACASKDMFTNAAERGDIFSKTVRELIEGKYEGNNTSFLR